jgi:hypothetical protein
MLISLTNSRSNGFKKWSDPHGSNDDDQLGGATLTAIATPPMRGSDSTRDLPIRKSIVTQPAERSPAED